MKLFSQLYTALDETTGTNKKIDVLVRYFELAPPEDAIWAIRFLIGKKPKRLASTGKLREWASEPANIPLWLFEESYEATGDLAETITLVLPESGRSSLAPLHEWVEKRLLPLRNMSDENRKAAVTSAWDELNFAQRFVYNKIITGGFRVGVSKKLVIRALSFFSEIDVPVIAHRLMGNWSPTAESYRMLLTKDVKDADVSRPYPFFLAHPLEEAPEKLGNISDWRVEWKWDGIRAQLIKRHGQVFIWSRGEELVTEKFPEVSSAAQGLPDGSVIDGELLSWRNGAPLDFGVLQTRIGRKKISGKILSDAPVVLMAYDLLESEGVDSRANPLALRRKRLGKIIKRLNEKAILVSPEVREKSWKKLSEVREQSREKGVEGFMLKRENSAYQVGRKRGDWWKWKVDPFTADAVMIYAQRGHGRRSGLYTDYTFAIWKDSELVPFAKAYSGLNDSEIRQVDRFIRRNTTERFGPVRSVKPELVFEIAFEGIRESKRHKSGVAVRFPRILRWRKDKPIREADAVETVKALIRTGQLA